ncbi:MAG: hypothetical protein ACJ74W_08290 [Pyrinomonadaceae bacterium]
MTAKTRRVFIVLCITVQMLILSGHGMAQTNVPDPLNQKATLVIDNNAYFILRVLSLKTKVPIGFEALPDELSRKGSSAISINVNPGTVRDALEAIVQADNRYTWELVNGVINVFPKDHQSSISDIEIPQFNVNDEEIAGIGFIITDLPEVRAKLKTLGVADNRMSDHGSAQQLKARVSFTLSKLTVREILNEMIKCNYINYWVIVRYGDSNELIRVQLF